MQDTWDTKIEIIGLFKKEGEQVLIRTDNVLKGEVIDIMIAIVNAMKNDTHLAAIISSAALAFEEIRKGTGYSTKQ